MPENHASQDGTRKLHKRQKGRIMSCGGKYLRANMAGLKRTPPFQGLLQGDSAGEQEKEKEEVTSFSCILSPTFIVFGKGGERAPVIGAASKPEECRTTHNPAGLDIPGPQNL